MLAIEYHDVRIFRRIQFRIHLSIDITQKSDGAESCHAPIPPTSTMGDEIDSKTLVSVMCIMSSASFWMWGKITRPLINPFQTSTMMTKVLAASSHSVAAKFEDSSKHTWTKNPNQAA